MRRAALALVIALAACGQTSEPPAAPEPPPVTVTPPWFICDAIDAPVLLTLVRENGVVHIAQYDKPNGALIQRTDYTIGAQEGAAGSVYTTLLQNGAEAGAIRQINPGMLETPGVAYTPPFTSVRIGEREISCRWMPRTRVSAFTGRRSFVVHEDQDGDLIYTTYDFPAAAQAQQIELSENGRSTTFSVEVRGGEEQMSARGVTYRFAGEDGFAYVVTLNRDGTGQLDVMREGADVQSEPLIAYQQGDGA
jgi:hypothetical protein